jgi:hypothetical protein
VVEVGLSPGTVVVVELSRPEVVVVAPGSVVLVVAPAEDVVVVEPGPDGQSEPVAAGAIVFPSRGAAPAAT